MFTVCMYVDQLASCVSTPESEYRDIELDLRRYIFGEDNVRFRTDVPPWDLSSATIYVIDFGALACYGSGSESTADCLTRELIRKIEDCPDTFFFLWSSMTVSNYKYMACESAGLDCLDDYRIPSNVFLFDSYSSEDSEKQFTKVRELLGLPKPDIDENKYIDERLKNSIVNKEDEDDVL